MTDNEEVPRRLFGRYPPAEITPAEFEDFVANVLRAGAPGVEGYRVTSHEVIQGVDGAFEFDATVRYEHLGMDFLIVVEAKRHAHPIKRELVQVLHSKALSVGAQKAVLVSTAPFQQGAIMFAKTHRIAMVFVTEGRFTFETKAATPTPTLSREQAEAYGIPLYVGRCFGPGQEPNSIQVTNVDPDEPELVQQALLDVRPHQPSD
jgi:hypothetical protein